MLAEHEAKLTSEHKAWKVKQEMGWWGEKNESQTHTKKNHKQKWTTTDCIQINPNKNSI